MKLFGKKKEQKLPPQVPGYMPMGTQRPPSPGPQKQTLAQNLGLDYDMTRLPPLPSMDTKDLPPPGQGAHLPPTTPESMHGDLPPLPSAPMTPDTQNMPMPQNAPPQQAPGQAPVFVRLDKYNDILSTVSQMEARINELQGSIKQINDIKDQEKQIVDNWVTLINEAKAKIDNVNAKLPNANQ